MPIRYRRFSAVPPVSIKWPYVPNIAKTRSCRCNIHQYHMDMQGRVFPSTRRMRPHPACGCEDNHARPNAFQFRIDRPPQKHASDGCVRLRLYANNACPESQIHPDTHTRFLQTRQQHRPPFAKCAGLDATPCRNSSRILMPYHRITNGYYSHSTNTNQFCLEIILYRIRGAFDYLIYPYYPVHMS